MQFSELIRDIGFLHVLHQAVGDSTERYDSILRRHAPTEEDITACTTVDENTRVYPVVLVLLYHLEILCSGDAYPSMESALWEYLLVCLKHLDSIHTIPCDKTTIRRMTTICLNMLRLTASDSYYIHCALDKYKTLMISIISKWTFCHPPYADKKERKSYYSKTQSLLLDIMHSPFPSKDGPLASDISVAVIESLPYDVLFHDPTSIDSGQIWGHGDSALRIAISSMVHSATESAKVDSYERFSALVSRLHYISAPCMESIRQETIIGFMKSIMDIGTGPSFFHKTPRRAVQLMILHDLEVVLFGDTLKPHTMRIIRDTYDNRVWADMREKFPAMAKRYYV